MFSFYKYDSVNYYEEVEEQLIRSERTTKEVVSAIELIMYNRNGEGDEFV